MNASGLSKTRASASRFGKSKSTQAESSTQPPTIHPRPVRQDNRRGQVAHTSYPVCKAGAVAECQSGQGRVRVTRGNSLVTQPPLRRMVGALGGGGSGRAESLAEAADPMGDLRLRTDGRQPDWAVWQN